MNCTTDRLEERKWHSKYLRQITSTLIISWLSIIVGYASAYSSPAEYSLMADLNLTTKELSWISSLLPVGALVGSVSGGPFAETFGRKKALLFTDLIFLIGWNLNYWSRNQWSMYMSRIFNGYAVGIISFAIPVYLAETLQSKIRGRLGLFPTIFGNFGILLCYVFGNLFEWRGLAFIGILLSIPFLVTVVLIPETPRWYLSKRKLHEAEESLKWLHGTLFADKDFQELQDTQNEKCRTHHQFKIFFIVLSLMFFQQFSGINAIIFYTTEIFEKSKSSVNASLCTSIIGIINFSSTFLAAAVVDKLGRKILLYISSSVVGCMLFTVGVYFYALKDFAFLEWLPLFCIIFYVLGFSLGLGPIPWLLMSEILPAVIRGQAASMSAAFNWACTFLITKTFPLFVESIGAYYAFWFFSFTMFTSLLFVKLYVPETKKRTLEDIERILSAN